VTQFITGQDGATWPVPPGVTPDPSIHNIPPQLQPTPITAEQIAAWRTQFIELIIRIVVTAVTGFFTQGATSAVEQLSDWANNIPGGGAVLDLISGLFGGTGFTGEQAGNLLNSLFGFFPALIDNLDGTGSANFLTTLIDNLDGTGTFSSAFTSLFDNGDGTGGSIFSILQNLIGAVGNYQNTLLQQQTIIDSLFNGLSGADIIGTDPTSLFDIIQNIPYFNVNGLGGPIDIGGSIQSTWDNLISGLVGQVGTGAGLADLFNISQTVSSLATLGGFSWDFLGIQTNTTIASGINATSESNLPLTQVSGGASAPTYAITGASFPVTTSMGFVRIKKSAAKTCVSWMGSLTGAMTEFYVNIFKMNPDGKMLPVYQSSNIVGSVSSSLAYNTHIHTAINVSPAETYALEFAMVGSGTYNMVGQSSWVPDHPTLLPKRLAASRNASILASEVTSIIPIEDAFDILDTDKWTITDSANVSINASRLQIVPSGAVPGITSIEHFDCTGETQVIVQAVQVSTGNVQTALALNSGADPNDWWEIQTRNGNLYFREVVNGVVDETSVVYNSTTHQWWRLRFLGNAIGWDTSTNGFDWVNRRGKTADASIDRTSMNVQLYANVLSGSGTTVLFDRFNRPNASELTYSDKTPFFEWSIDAAAVPIQQADPPVYHSPETHPFTSSGGLFIPAWVNRIDVIAFGGGGGGHQGGSWGIAGNGGNAGVQAVVSWYRTTHFSGEPTASITVGNGGAGGGGFSANGNPGSATTITIPGHTLTAPGGAGGYDVNFGGGNSYGRAAGNIVYNGITYVGGGQQNTQGGAGAYPGGGGAGGNWISLQPGGNGAKGEVWLVLNQ